MLARGFGFVVAFSSLIGGPASAATPIGDWKIEPSDIRCVAVRQYGDSSKPITLALKASLVEDTYQLAVLRAGYRSSPLQSEAAITVDGQSYSASALSYPIGSDKRRVSHLISLDADISAAIRKAESLSVTIVEGINDSFRMTPSEALWRSLGECVQRLRTAWNVGDDRRLIVKAPPRGNLRPLFSRDDYPLAMVLAEKGGSTRFSLLIDEDGKVRDCTVSKPSGVALLDTRSCAIIVERAKFAPAIGLDGKPAKSFWIQTVTWKI